MPFIALIGGIISFIESIMGAILPTTKAALGSGILGAVTSGSGVAGVLGVVESLLGKLTDEQTQALKANLEIALAQIQENSQEDASPNKFLSGWRPFLAWGLSIIVVLHCGIIELINILGVFGVQRALMNPLDTITVSMITGLLGMYGIARTVEKYNGNAK